MIITKEQIIAGALINKFNRITNLDFDIIVKKLKEKYNNVEISNKMSGLEEYIEIKKDSVYINNETDLDRVVINPNTTLENYCYNIAGKKVIDFFKNYTMDYHILNKIELLSPLDNDTISFYFSKKELKILKEKIKNGCIEILWVEDVPFMSYQLMSLSKKGHLEIYKKEHEKEVNDFIKVMKTLRCNPTILDEYLLETYNKSWNPLNINCIYDYCKDKNISITIPGASEVHFVPCSQEELMYNLKNDNGNIIIALPNDILKTPIVTEEVTRIENIKWDEIVMNKILKNQKYRTITDNIKEEARKIVSDLSIDYRNKVEDKANRGITSYLAIIEQDKEGKYILKSILQYDYLGLEISYNPKYNNHPQKLQLNK